MDTKEATKTAEPQGITVPVMDVQRPRQTPAEVTSAPLLAESQPAAEVEQSSVPVATNDVQPAEEEKSETAADESPGVQQAPPEETPADAGATTPEVAAPADDASSPPQTPVPTTAQNGDKHHSPYGAVVAAVVIAVLLAGLTVFAYLKTSGNKTATGTNKSSTQAVPAPVTSNEVDQTNSQIDDAMKSANDTEDFGSTDLSDSALGL